MTVIPECAGTCDCVSWQHTFDHLDGWEFPDMPELVMARRRMRYHAEPMRPLGFLGMRGCTRCNGTGWLMPDGSQAIGAFTLLPGMTL